ncbi:MAG TPA: type II secretion system F family protein [Acidimicrobiales bacterium]
MAMAVVGALALSPPLAVAVLVATWLSRRWRAARQLARRRIDIRARLPDVIDLVAVALMAGLTPRLALPRLAQLAPAPFDAAFAAVLERLDHGARLADAWPALADELGDEARPLAAALSAGDRYGVPLGPALDLLASEARHARRRHAEASARRLPIRLAFPLTCCILPAFLLLTVVPVLGRALDQLPHSGGEPPPSFLTPGDPP